MGKKLKMRGLFELPEGDCKEQVKEVIHCFLGLHQVRVVGSAVMSQLCFTINIASLAAYRAT